jgi:hypothetical protein
MRFVLLAVIRLGCIGEAHAYCENARSATDLDLCARRYGGEPMPWDYRVAPNNGGGHVQHWQWVCPVNVVAKRMCHYEMR